MKRISKTWCRGNIQFKVVIVEHEKYLDLVTEEWEEKQLDQVTFNRPYKSSYKILKQLDKGMISLRIS